MASLVPAGAAAGTPYAMAPEQVRGEAADARTDIWALGVLLYEMVTGAQPFTGATVPELFSSILRDAPRPWPDGVAVADQAGDRALPGKRSRASLPARASKSTRHSRPSSQGWCRSGPPGAIT